MDHRLSNGRHIKVLEQYVYGLCDGDEITVDPRSNGKEHLDTFIHELLHAEFPKFDEKRVSDVANSISSMLWDLGYRRKYHQKRKTAKRKPYKRCRGR